MINKPKGKENEYIWTGKTGDPNVGIELQENLFGDDSEEDQVEGLDDYLERNKA